MEAEVPVADALRISGRNTGQTVLRLEANRLAAGSPYTPQVHYRTVAGRALQGRQNGRGPERRAWRNYSFFVGRGNVWGDGTVPVESASLDGAEALVLEGVVHSLKFGRNWYGEPGIIRRWWPGGREDHAG